MGALNFHGLYDMDNQDRVKVKSHGHEVNHASIQSIWLEDSFPDIDTYVSDVGMYQQLISYLMSFMDIPYSHNVIDVSKPVLNQVGHVEAQEILEGYPLLDEPLTYLK